MRLPIAIFLGFGLLSLTSCNETPEVQPNSSPPEAGSTSSDTEATPAADAAEDRHGHQHASGHAGHGHAHSEQHGTDSGAIAIGDKVPDFEVVIDGKTWKLSELQGDPDVTSDGTLVLTFWCSFCHSCRNVEHQLDKLAAEYRGKVGVMALDASAGETAAGVAAFAAEEGLTLPIALSSGGAAADIFGTRVTTTTVVIDGDGILRYCGQFSDRENNFAEDALQAVLADEEVPVQKTRQKG